MNLGHNQFKTGPVFCSIGIKQLIVVQTHFLLETNDGLILTDVWFCSTWNIMINTTIIIVKIRIKAMHKV